jgi:hypothetical protein
MNEPTPHQLAAAEALALAHDRVVLTPPVSEWAHASAALYDRCRPDGPLFLTVSVLIPATAPATAPSAAEEATGDPTDPLAEARDVIARAEAQGFVREPSFEGVYDLPEVLIEDHEAASEWLAAPPKERQAL